MNKLLTLALLALAGLPAAQGASADKAVRPSVMLFSAPDCGHECDSVRSMLKFRKVNFQEVDVNTLEGLPGTNKYGVSGYPTTLVGKNMVRGTDLMEITALLAESFGKNVLTPDEQMALAGHFDKKGRPKVVLYGTKWCGYCKKERALLNAKHIDFVDVDVEASVEATFAYNTLKGTGYPLTYVGYRRFAGFQNEALLDAVSQLSGKVQANVR